MLEYLRLTRAHTAPLEAVPALLGAALATGTLWNIQVALWGFVGILYHLAGYGQNSLVDWQNGYDRDDEHKEHHPLNRGTITETQASRFIYLLMAATAVLTLALAYPSINSIIFIVVAIIFGMIYNIAGKTTEYKFIFISVAHSMLFIIPYFALNGDFYNGVLWTGFIAVFLWVAFQISVSGEIKDIMQDESNFLTDVLDTDTEMALTEITMGPATIIYAVLLKAAGLSFIYLTYILNPKVNQINTLWFIIFTISGIVTMQYTIRLVVGFNFNRRMRINWMSKIEMFTLVTFTLAFVPVIGWESVIIVSVVSIQWALIGNKLLWSSVFAPRV